MSWEAWTLVSIFVLAALLNVGLVGRPRPTLTPGAGVVGVIFASFEVWLILRLAGVA